MHASSTVGPDQELSSRRPGIPAPRASGTRRGRRGGPQPRAGRGRASRPRPASVQRRWEALIPTGGGARVLVPSDPLGADARGGRPRRARARARRAAPPRPLRLTGRGRVVLVLVAVIVLLGSFAAGRSSGAGPGQRSGRVAVSVVVQPGQTLWDLAAEVAPAADRRVTMERIRRMNDLPGPTLTPGQRVLVPAR